MIRDVKPFDNRQWDKLQEDMKRSPTEAQKEKMAKIHESVLEVSRLVDF